MSKPLSDNLAGEEMQPTLLFIASDAEQRYGLRDLLQAQDYEVYCRTTRMRAFQLMTVYQIDLVIIDLKLEDGSGIACCHDFRADNSLAAIPIVMVGEDSEDGAQCIQAFAAGADDFVQAPFVPGVCLARLNRLLSRRMKTRNQVKTSLSVDVAAGELPGILQYLEAEVKTGKLTVKSPHGAVVIHINIGKFAHATGPLCEGVEALTEALSWEKSQVTFEEVELKPAEIKGEQAITSVLMNCVVDVDEYREAKKELPPSDAMFLPGVNRPPKTMPRNQRLLWEQALNGYSSDELLNDQPFGERQATLWLRDLIDQDFLDVTDPPFHNYTANTFEFYARTIYKDRLLSLRKILTEVTFPINLDDRQLPLHPANWISPAAKIVVTGDRPDHVQLFFDSMAAIYRHHTKKLPPSHQNLPGAETLRLDFGDRNILDLQKLPPVLEKRFLQSLDDYLAECVAVIMIATEQTRKATQMNLRLIRQIRMRFKGVFFNVVPKVTDRDGRTLFKLDCQTCGYRLAVDMDEAGNQGECPICNAGVMIPDALDHLAHTIQLPSDVPIVLVEPGNPRHIRDLILLVIDTIAYALNPPADALDKAKAKVAATSELRERGTKPPDQKIQAAPQSSAKPPPPPADAPAIDLDDEDDDEDDDDGQPEELAQILNLSVSAPTARQTAEIDPSVDLDDLLRAQDDDFDIDDFIKRVTKD